MEDKLVTTGDKVAERRVVPIKEGVFHIPTSPDDEPYLIGSKCSNCCLVMFPKRAVCPACIRDDTMEATRLGRKAKLEAFTIVWQAPPGFTAPYIQGIVTLADGPRIYAMITGVEPKEEALKVGQELEVVIDRLREDEQGNTILAYKFRPVTER